MLAAGLALRLAPLLAPIGAESLRSPSFTSVSFTDRHGALLQEVLSRDESQALRVPLSSISPYFVGAMIAAEDRRFPAHGGVDWRAAARAAARNVAAGRVVAGGSTITLQLARMLRPAPRTLRSKAREAFRAWRLEAGMSKDEILEEYLNRLPMGGNLYGVEAAARACFGIPAADLSLAQASFLAAVPNSPTRLNPFRHPERVRRRQRYVLERMAATGAVDAGRASLAARERIGLRPEEASFLAPHFVFHLLDGLPPGVQQVRTTVDSELQRMVGHEVRETVRLLAGRRVSGAAAILVGNRGGEVLAYVGSPDFFDVEAGGQNDGVRSLRQPGSTLKPFLYGLAFERGYTPASLLADVPLALPMPEGVFRPRNYGETFLGPVRARTALASSLNVPAVRLVSALGVAPFLERLRAVGLRSLDRDAGHYGAGLALGDGEVRLAELAGAYLCLASGGAAESPREVLALDGVAVAPPEPPPGQVVDPRAAWLVTSVLSDRFARAPAFGVDSVLALPFPCAVKTGTSFRFADNWTVGYTRDYTVAVWVGNFDGTPMQKVSGVSGAGPLFTRIVTALYEGRDAPPAIARPPGLADVTVCALSGRSPSPSCPRTVAETVPEERLEAILAAPCDMHRGGSTVYPEAFRGWALDAGLGEGGEAEGGAAPGGFSISRPADGTVFRRLPDLAPDFQSVLFELRASADPGEVQWLLDGERLAVTTWPHRLLWKASPGGHRLTATAAGPGGPSDAVAFTVR